MTEIEAFCSVGRLKTRYATMKVFCGVKSLRNQV